MNSSKTYIRVLDNKRTSDWDQYVTQHKDGTIFHSLQWRDIICAEYGFKPLYLLSESGNGISGILPLFQINNLSGKKLVSLPLSMYGGPLSDSCKITELLLTYGQHLAEKNGAILQTRLHDKKNQLPLKEAIEIDSYVVVPSCGPEEWFKKFPVSIRTSIRKALKNDLTVRIGGIELLDDFYYTLLYARRRLRVLTPRKAYYQHILNQINSGIIAINHRDETVSTCLYFCDEKHLYYVSQGLSAKGRNLSAGDLCIWELLQLAKRLDRLHVYLGGSPTWHKGLIDFKSRWGSIQTPIYNYPRIAHDRSDTIKQQGLPVVRWLPSSILGTVSRTAIRLFY